MKLLIASNRLPVVVENTDGRWNLRPGSGGLVTALAPMLRRRGGTWVGWPGLAQANDPALIERLVAERSQVGFSLVPVPLSEAEIEGFYRGWSNEVIWPLFHDLQSRCNFEPDYWRFYSVVKDRYTAAIEASLEPDHLVWVHDYHLMGVGQRLREHGVAHPIGFFLHIPFPPPDIFCKLPWRIDVLEELLHYDVVGFQTPRDVHNFCDCVRTLLPRIRVNQREGRIEGAVASGPRRRIAIGAFPIGIDFDEFAAGAAQPDVAQRVAELRRSVGDQQVVLSVDRLDYTKGIPERLRAFGLALQRYPELRRKIALLQFVVPSRVDVPEYADLKAQIERQVGQINGEFAEPGWVPVQHMFRSLPREELLALYRLGDVGLVTPLKDGMNLVAKEYCACQIDGNGVLVLSEFAGAAVQLGKAAMLVNPYDLGQVASVIRRAALTRRRDRRRAMEKLRRLVKREDVHGWTQRFLAGFGRDVEPAPAPVLTAEDGA